MTLQKLIARRATLVQEIAQQRKDITVVTHALERPLSFFDKGYRLTQRLKQQPQLVAAGVLLFVVVFRKPIFRKRTSLIAATKWLLKRK